MVKISIQISMRSKFGLKFRYSDMDSQLQYLVVQNLWTKCDIERYFETLANCKLKETLIWRGFNFGILENMPSRSIAPTRSSVSYSKSHYPSCLNCPNCHLQYACHSPSVRPTMSRHLLERDNHHLDRNQGDNSGRPNDKKSCEEKVRLWIISKHITFYHLNVSS